MPVNRIVSVRSPLCEAPVLLDAAGIDPIASMLYWRGTEGWEPETLPVFLRLVQPGATVLDVGANTGLFSLLAARRAEGVTVHALEPVPRVFRMLEDNVLRNDVTSIVCHRLALSDTPGTVTMYVPVEDLPIMASMLPEWRSDSEQIEVSAESLDQFVARLGLCVDVIKIDTEGTEALVLEGARNTLATQQPFVICEVLAAGGTADLLTALITEADYQIFLLAEDGPRATGSVLGNEADGCRNYLFVPHSRIRQAQDLLHV